MTTSMECIVCCVNTKKEMITDCCNQICLTCTQTWITNLIKKPAFFKNNSKPHCMACKKNFNDEKLGTIIDKETLELFKSGIPFIAKEKFCPDCEIPITSEKFSQFMKCGACFNSFCYYCLGEMIFHEDSTCEECYKKIIVNQGRNTFLSKNKCFYFTEEIIWDCKEEIDILKGEEETVKWKNEFTKLCPECHSAIEKNGGCLHMVCDVCNYEFCWECGENWSEHKGEPYRCDQTGITINPEEIN